jgi:hypothetical protein
LRTGGEADDLPVPELHLISAPQGQLPAFVQT